MCKWTKKCIPFSSWSDNQCVSFLTNWIFLMICLSPYLENDSSSLTGQNNPCIFKYEWLILSDGLICICLICFELCEIISSKWFLQSLKVSCQLVLMPQNFVWAQEDEQQRKVTNGRSSNGESNDWLFFTCQVSFQVCFKRREWLCPCFFLKILRRTEEYRGGVLTRAADHVQEWGSKVKKMKAIYYTLNLCNIDITQKLIVAEIWCPVSDLSLVQNALIMGSVCMFIHCLEKKCLQTTITNNSKLFKSPFASGLKDRNKKVKQNNYPKYAKYKM